jgi:RIP metalloprotease RseP
MVSHVLITLFNNAGNLLAFSSKKGAAAAQKQVGEVISAIKGTPDGESVTLKIKRANKDAVDIVVQPKKADPSSTPSIGVMLSPTFLETKKLQSDNSLEAARLAYDYFSGIFQQTLGGFLNLLGGLLTGKGPPPGQSVSGPIGLIKTGTEIVSTKDLATVLAFAGALSINLGVVNALPLPALDGGQLVFVLAEALTGRKVNQRLQEGITSVTVLLLLFITVSSAFTDVGNILLSWK